MVDYCGFYAHKGMMLSANNLKEEVQSIMDDLVTQYPQYSIAVVGHSLGAGAGVLLTHQWWRDHQYHGKFKAVMFAPPACLSLELAREAESYCHSLILNDDIVPRLSTRSMALLLHDLDTIGTAVLETLKAESGELNALVSAAINDVIRMKKQTGAGDEKVVGVLEKRLQAPVDNLSRTILEKATANRSLPKWSEEQLAKVPELAPPMACTFLSWPYKGEASAYMRPAASFNEIVLSESCLLDHRLTQYQAGLYSSETEK